MGLGFFAIPGALGSLELGGVFGVGMVEVHCFSFFSLFFFLFFFLGAAGKYDRN